MKFFMGHSFNNQRKLKVKNILSRTINQHTPENTTNCFHRSYWMDVLHVHIMAGGHKFSKNLEAISKTWVSEEWHQAHKL